MVRFSLMGLEYSVSLERVMSYSGISGQKVFESVSALTAGWFAEVDMADRVDLEGGWGLCSNWVELLALSMLSMLTGGKGSCCGHPSRSLGTWMGAVFDPVKRNENIITIVSEFS